MTTLTDQIVADGMRVGIPERIVVGRGVHNRLMLEAEVYVTPTRFLNTPLTMSNLMLAHEYRFERGGEVYHIGTCEGE